MAVNAINDVTNTPTETPKYDSGSDINNGLITEDSFAKMTAKEIVDCYNNKGLDVPAHILAWAKNEIDTNPDSDLTWGNANSTNSQGGTEQDEVSYRGLMEADGLSIEDQCKALQSTSRVMEKKDLQNVQTITQYLPFIDTSASEGEESGSEVNQLFKEVTNKGLGLLKGRNLKFFFAVSKGMNEVLETVNANQESMQETLNSVIDQTKQSNATGSETKTAGSDLLSNASWYSLGKKFLGHKTIKQGQNTQKTSDTTSQYATAIANDLGIAINTVETNIDNIEALETEAEGEATTEGSNTSAEGGDTSAPTTTTTTTTTTTATTSTTTTNSSSVATV